MEGKEISSSDLPKICVRPSPLVRKPEEFAALQAAQEEKKSSPEVQVEEPVPEPVIVEPERAREEDGTFRADDPATTDVDEAWVGGKSPESPKDTKESEKTEEPAPEPEPVVETPPPPKPPYKMKIVELVDWLDNCGYEREDLEQMKRIDLIRFVKSEGLC